LNSFLNEYVIAALWSSTDGQGIPLDDSFTISDIDKNSIKEMESDCTAFLSKSKDILERVGLDDSQVAHDFWFSRNGHGSGFWDHGLGEDGEELTKIAKSFGECHLEVGEDNVIYII